MVSVVEGGGWATGEGEAVFDSVCVSTGFGESQFLRIGLKPVLKEPILKRYLVMNFLLK